MSVINKRSANGDLRTAPALAALFTCLALAIPDSSYAADPASQITPAASAARGQQAGKVLARTGATSPTGSVSVIVKFRHALAGDVRAALHPQTLTLTARQPQSSSLRSFMTRHAVLSLRPVFGQFTRAAMNQGLNEAQRSARVRQRFPARARRASAVFPSSGMDRTYLLVCSTDASQLANLLAQLNADADVEYAEQDHIIQVTTELPNDPYLATSGTWGQPYADLWGVYAIGAPAAWPISTGAGITVAIVDTGVDLTHHDIAGNLWTNPGETSTSTTDLDGDSFVGDRYGWNFVSGTSDVTDDFGHGTHIAGTIAASAGNGLGIAGIAYSAKVMAVKAIDATGGGTDSNLASAIVYATDRGADVINMSWGGFGTSQVISDAIDYAYSSGVVLVASAGNSQVDAGYFYPAGLPHVITVAATDTTGALASFSDWGPKIDVSAPGVDILSLQAAQSKIGAVVSPGYMRLSGTSMSAPHVSGLVALLLSAHPEYTNEAVRQAMRVSSSMSGGFDAYLGYGVVNCASALAVTGPLEARIMTPVNSQVFSGPVQIDGVARGAGLASYQLAWGIGAAPSAWTTFSTSNTPANGVLGTLDASQFANGTYTILLTALNGAGADFTDRVQFTAATAYFSYPPVPHAPTSANTVKPGPPLQITGTAIGAGFRGFKLEWAPGVNTGVGWQTAGINLAGAGVVPVANSVLGVWDTKNIATAGFYTLQLTVFRDQSTDTALTMVYFEPDLISDKWPVSFRQLPWGGAVPACDSSGVCRLTMMSPWVQPVYGSVWSFALDATVREYPLPLPGIGSFHQPSVVSLRGGRSEQVVAADSSVLRVYSPDGSNESWVPSVPVDMSWALVPIADLTSNQEWTAFVFGSDRAARLGYVFAWTGDGTPLGGNFPLVVQDQNWASWMQNRVRVLAADLDGDGRKEIVVVDGVGETSYTLRLFSSDGTPRQWAVPVLAGVPRSLAAADFDGNGRMDIVSVTYVNNEALDGGTATIDVFDKDGKERAGWPQVVKYTATNPESYLAIGDLAQDGRKEIVWSPQDSVFVFDADGKLYSSGWPVRIPSNSPGFGAVVLGDVDGDGKPEIVTTRTDLLQTQDPFFINPPGSVYYHSGYYYDQKLMAFHLNGSLSRSWQLTGMNGRDSYVNPVAAIGDFSGRGRTELAVDYSISGTNEYVMPGVLTVLDTGVTYRPENNPWPYSFQNRRNNPVLDDEQPAVSAEGVVNAASGVGSQIAPGELIIVNGSLLGPEEAQFVPLGAAPTELGDIQVVFDGIPATLSYSQSQRLYATVPDSVAGQRSVSMIVRKGDIVSAPVKLRVQPSLPGLFAAIGTSGQAVALNADGRLNSASHPAVGGSNVTIYATGDGLRSVLPNPQLPLSVAIAGRAARVISAFGGSELPAILQIVVQIPIGLAANSAAPLVLTIGVAASQGGITIAVE